MYNVYDGRPNYETSKKNKRKLALFQRYKTRDVAFGYHLIAFRSLNIIAFRVLLQVGTLQISGIYKKKLQPS